MFNDNISLYLLTNRHISLNFYLRLTSKIDYGVVYLVNDKQSLLKTLSNRRDFFKFIDFNDKSVVK